MPLAVTVGTGLDAFVHAIEACSGATPQLDRRRRGAARACASCSHHLPRVAVDGSDLGCAPGDAGGGLPRRHGDRQLRHRRRPLDRPRPRHRCITCPHGISVAVGLDAALEWNVEGEPERYADVASGTGLRRRRACPNVLRRAVRRRHRSRVGRCAIAADMSVDRDIAATMERRREPADAASTTRGRIGDDDRRCSPTRTVERVARSCVHERDRRDRHHAPSTAARPAVPGVVGPAAAHQVPGHASCASATATGATASARAT